MPINCNLAYVLHMQFALVRLYKKYEFDLVWLQVPDRKEFDFADFVSGEKEAICDIILHH